MSQRNCGVCNRHVPIDHEQIGRYEKNGNVTPYHMRCEYGAGLLKPCEDCEEHRAFCNDCGEPTLLD